MIEAGSTYLSFHSEMLMNEAFRTAHYLHKHGRKLGVVLVPGAPIEMIYPYISHLDKITVMMVDPGFSGGIFVPEALDTVRKLKELRKEKGYHYIVEADGQCNEKHFTELKQAGVESYIVGSGLFGLMKQGLTLDEAYYQLIRNIENA